jgi:hypothetical protein
LISGYIKTNLYIRGIDRDEDDKIFLMNCKNEGQAIALCEDIKAGVDKINSRAIKETDVKDDIIKVI